MHRWSADAQMSIIKLAVTQVADIAVHVSRLRLLTVL